MAKSKMTPIRIPADLLQSIDEHVGPRQRSKFIIEASQRELIRQKQLQALAESAGAWQDKDHPDLPNSLEGLQAFLRQARAEAERRPTS